MVLSREYEIKIRGRLGPDEKDIKRIDILGRILELEKWGCSWKADPRHRKLVLQHFGFDNSTKHLQTNGVKEVETEGGCDDTPLNPQESTAFRALVARLNYLSMDCPNLQYPTKEICREMSAPTTGAYRRLKRLVRYVVGVQEVKWYFRWQNLEV